MSECPWCAQAERRRLQQEQTNTTHNEDSRTFTRLVWAFVLMLLTNVILMTTGKDMPAGRPLAQEDCQAYLTSLSVAEGVDTLVIIICVLATARYLRLPEGAGRSPRAAWLLAVPLLAALLTVNYGYHHVLLWLSGAEPIRDRIAESGHYPLWQLATNCLQPAIVEELFFRGVVFGWLCHAVGPGSAAFATASMFAAAHTGGLASFPVLFLIGAGMAWIRWKTGRLILPMLLHFLHNFIVGLL